MTPRRLQDWVTRQAYRRPESLAVVCGHTRLTYGELDTLSTQLARLLDEGGCRRGDRVALLMPKSAMAIVALLGIYKADAVYVPLDASSPASRLKKILASCENRWLLAAGAVGPALEELGRDEEWRRQLQIGWLDDHPALDHRFNIRFTIGDVRRCPAVPLPTRNGPDDPAHILFTSGSTGTPKGVVITHANVISTVEWAVKYFSVVPSDRLSGHFPLHFDLSFFDIFSAAAVGAELHLVPPELNVLPSKLVSFIRQSEITQWFSVPSVLSYVARFNVAGFNDFPALKRMLWCGEVLPTPSLIYWMKRLPHVTFTNLYGPTETTIVSSYYTVPACPEDAQASIPIGVPCDGEELLVLNESLQPAPSGEIGDLYIGGTGLAQGYWRDPERTAAAFVPDPRRPSERIYRTGDLARIGDDGLVYFLGRSDSQIKSRGYRIELGEIEAALNTVRGVQQSAVVAVDTGGFEGAAICCAYVPAAGSALTPATLRRELSRVIPAYMLPARWLPSGQLPVNANGKIDRRRIKEIFEAGVDAHAPEIARLA
jgi:amino acid adenylation domain-containing protein